MNYKDYFKDKRVTFAGLGENNKALADAQFLAKLGANVIVTDTCRAEKVEDLVKKMRMPSVSVGSEMYQAGQGDGAGAPITPPMSEHIQEQIEHQLESHMPEAAAAAAARAAKQKKKDWRENVSFTFGGFKKEDFENRDLIIRDLTVPPETAVLVAAVAAGIPVDVPECLFAKLAPSITIVGVTGTCGKSTVAAMASEILKKTFKGMSGKEHFYFIDPYQGWTPLALLSKVVREDVVLLELPARLLEEFDKAHISPHISVITNLFPDQIEHYGSAEAYFKQKAAILKYQTYNNFFIANDEVVDFIKGNFELPFKAKILRTSVNIIPAKWQLENTHYHMRENISLAIRVAEMLKVPIEDMQNVVERFVGLPGRLELVKKARGVSFYNDGTSTHPQSTLTALKCVAQNKNVVLIWGGKNRDVPLDVFLQTIPQYVSVLVLLPGSGTLKFHRHLMENEDSMKHVYAHSIYDAVQLARDNAGKGDVVLFSPGFPATGQSEVARGEEFVWSLKGVS